MPGILSDSYLDAIKGFEGYQPKAGWDYKQYTNGYGTRAANPGEVIDRDTADQRFRNEIGNASGHVDAAFPQLPDGARAALTSLTYNAGPGWIKSGLGDAVRSGDWANARNLFLQYNKAGGQALPGLANRRAQEAAWLIGAQGPQPMSAAAIGAQSTPAGVPLTANASNASEQQSGGNPYAALGALGLGMMQGAPITPFLQVPQRPQVDYSGLQALINGSRSLTPLTS